MTIVANTFLTFSAIGNKESVRDVIYMISPTETPFTAAIGSSKASAVLEEWLTDALDAAAANAQLEGDDIAFSAVTPLVRLNNRCQISFKTCIVSTTQDAVKKYGRKKEFTMQIMKRSKELRRDMEFVLTNNQAPNAGNSTTARQLRPLCGWYSTNVSRGASGANGTTSAAATDGTQRALTETLVKTVLQSIWTNGGQPDMLMCGPFNRGVISGFTGNSTRIQDTSNGKLMTSIDVYGSDWGDKLKIVPNRIQRDRDLHILDTSMWEMGWLQPIHTMDLAQTGLASKGAVVGEYTLFALNEAASGIVADLTTS